MTWGPLFMYYTCPNCSKKCKYELNLMISFGLRFGCCPRCGEMGEFVKDSPQMDDDEEYEEVD